MGVRDVPHQVARDRWWLEDADPPRGVRAGPLLIVTVLLADALFWDVRLGAGIAVWMMLAGGMIAATVYRSVNPGRFLMAFAVLIAGVAPLLEVVQLGTVVVAVIGLSAFGVMIASDRFDVDDLLRCLRRLPGHGLVLSLRDAFRMRVSLPSKGRASGVLLDWALPVVIGGIFVVLLVAANPVMDRWMLTVFDFNPDIMPSGARSFFWMILAFLTWPLLRLADMQPALSAPNVSPKQGWRSGFVNARSVLRALMTFNLIFAMQTLLDVSYLWGGVALPDGMTYAEYAHRGAYPLLATAVLAGVFALITQPYLGDGKLLRGLLYLWIGQTVVLVISSILRLDLYVDVYGLTRLRFAAFVWMTVVALGLVLIIMQIRGRHSIVWFLHRALALGVLAIYLCNLINIDGFIARQNLADDRANDDYLCELSEGAVPAIEAYHMATGEELCSSRRPFLSRRSDWREWGYRNMRLHRSLAALEGQQ